MNYLAIYIPLILMAFAYGYNRKYHRLMDTGRIPDVLSANRRSKLFLFLAVGIFIVLIIINRLD